MIIFDYFKRGIAKGTGIIDLSKVKAEHNNKPQYNLYDPISCRVINLDDVQSFVINENDIEILHMIAEKGFALEQIEEGWYICRRKR